MARIMGALITASVIACIPVLESLIFPNARDPGYSGDLTSEREQLDAARAVVLKIAPTAWTRCLPRTCLLSGGC